MNYIQLTCTIESVQLQLVQEMLMQELADRGYESFDETENGLLAWVPENLFDEIALNGITFHNELKLGTIRYAHEMIADRNWNEEWETNFEPVLVANRCYLRAPFHPERTDIEYDIVMSPKMAFGTGHHETTSSMVESMLSLDFKGKNVLDMGCGTGVLAIMASKLGASNILAIDIDEWAYNSTVENSEANGVQNIKAVQGDIDKVEGTFDIVLANINRNILLSQMEVYANSLPSNGTLLLSGIYKSDIEVINEKALACGFEMKSFIEKNNWVAVLFIKG